MSSLAPSDDPRAAAIGEACDFALELTTLVELQLALYFTGCADATDGTGGAVAGLWLLGACREGGLGTTLPT